MIEKNIPTCPVCNQPMIYTDTINAVKNNEKIKLRVFTCYRDQTFDKTEA